MTIVARDPDRRRGQAHSGSIGKGHDYDVHTIVGARQAERAKSEGGNTPAEAGALNYRARKAWKRGERR